jgi:hypothetical protein
MVLAELRDLIRAEAMIQGIREYQNLIDWLINQELTKLTGKHKYSDLITSYIFTASVDQTSSFSLPSDYQLLENMMYLPNPDINPQWTNAKQLVKGIYSTFLQNFQGYPNFYVIQGQTIFVYPYTAFNTGDQINLSYYKRPQLLNDSDVIPVPALENVLQLFVMARMWFMKDTAKGQVMRGMANEALIAARAEYAGK